MVRVCVFGSSSNKTPDEYLKVSEELGALIASNGHLCVNGGGAAGCMGALNRGVRSKGGQILGVIHDMFSVETEDGLIQEMLVTNGDTLSEREQMLVTNSDCIIVLPGGVGTLDELWESVCNKSLHLGGMEKVPICVLNYNGYFDGCIAQLERASKDKLLYQPVSEYMHVETSAKAALECSIKALKNNDINDGADSAFRKQRRDTSFTITNAFKADKLPSVAIGITIGIFITSLCFNSFKRGF